MTIGDKIRARRLELGLLQSFVAEKAGISPITLSQIETNITQWPRSNSIAPLADALQVTTDYLLREKETDAEPN